MTSRTKHYTSDEIDVYFHPDRCTHVSECVKRLPSVFNPNNRPWVNPEQGTSDEIAYVIEKCPTGALEYVRKDKGIGEMPPENTIIEPQPDGVYFVTGNLHIKQDEHTIHCTRAALCSCGLSSNKPFCDDSHKENRK
ncbi:(4Fe-4S)-binding protein [Jeotgalibacillus soli]|uniref:Iron-binding zinc finger CDGSH type domain-containing protein n=1 Tax=Jeotgalibacillus soli TaxID=889306 RepID=A0A0C2SDJ9_9BACL|nr:(4Fe-4S)-binding protein [Jeotgalibacillus soli]KIL52019.1 hypothetical protein KP78_03890 [Jeotgalibacillus soli]